MKRTERVGALIKILTESPNRIYSLQYFCDLFGAAKSSVSEDIQSASQAIAVTGSGYLETIAGSKGGVRFVPDISQKEIEALQAEFSRRLVDPSRLLGGNFLYTSDIFYDSDLVTRTARVFAKAAALTVSRQLKPRAFRSPSQSRICWAYRWRSFAEKQKFRRVLRSASIISVVPMTVCKKCPCPNVRSRRARRF